MVTVDRPAANGFVQYARKLYNPLGFSKGYNALLWFIFDGAMFGFVLARLQYLNIWGVFCGSAAGAAASECYYYTNFDRNKVGIVLHLGTILPAGLFAVFQFVPVIRHKAILYHRIAGYVILLLVLVSDAGAIMVANHSFGGDYTTQMFVGFLIIATTISLVLAYINIKRLQIDQHRAWMLRAWFYFASIITLRLIQAIAFSIEGIWPASQNYGAKPCDELLYVYGNSTQLYGDYPACDPSNAAFATDGYVAVKGDFNGNVASIMMTLSLNFGMAGVLALFLHAIGIEIYLKLTPREGERLRQVSYERQLERGYANPGSAGLVLEKFGDAEPWVPKGAKASKERPRPVAITSDSS